MRLRRIVRIAVPVLLVAIVVGAVVSVVTARPDLRDARDRVANSWSTLAPQLDSRYGLLANATAKVGTITGPVREVAAGTATALEAWTSARQSGNVENQVRAANALEAWARRLVVTAGASPRVGANADAKQALGAFLADRSFVTAPDFNAAVAGYEAERNGPVRSIVARMLGDANVPALDTTAVTPT